MVPLAKFDISLKNTPPGLAPFCTESWQRFPPIFFSISLIPTNIVVRVHAKNYGKTRKTKGIYRKTRKPLWRRELLNGYIVMLRARMFRSLIIRTEIKERNIRARNVTI